MLWLSFIFLTFFKPPPNKQDKYIKYSETYDSLGHLASSLCPPWVLLLDSETALLPRCSVSSNGRSMPLKWSRPRVTLMVRIILKGTGSYPAPGLGLARRANRKRLHHRVLFIKGPDKCRDTVEKWSKHSSLCINISTSYHKRLWHKKTKQNWWVLECEVERCGQTRVTFSISNLLFSGLEKMSPSKSVRSTP